MDEAPITAKSLSQPYHIDADKFERAYKDILSGYRTWKHALHAGQWLVFPRNVGERLCIDETSMSDGELYTIVSNPDARGRKGTLVAIVKGTRIEDVAKAINRIYLYEREKVRQVTMDFSESMRSIVQQCFPYAIIIPDRFHLQKLCNDAVQECRMICKRDATAQNNKERKDFEQRKRQRQKQRKQGRKDPGGRKRGRKNEAFQPFRFPNGDTRMELLTRSRYLLTTSPDKWSSSQKVRADLLFKEYTMIATAYGISHSLRVRMSKEYRDRDLARASIKDWCEQVEVSRIEAFTSVLDTVRDRTEDILNYFIGRSSNAFAESFNSKIKHFRAQLRGVTDVEFFLFRLSTIFG